MTTYACKKCPVKPNGVKTYHPGIWACPKEPSYDPGRVAKYEERRAAAKNIMRGEPATVTPTAPAAEAAPAEKKSSVLEHIELGSKIAETARRDASQPQAETDWLLPADAAETFYSFIRNLFKNVADWLDDLLDAKSTKEGRIKPEVFELNQHDLAAARSGFGQRFATKVVKGLGARTLAEGIATVDSLAFLALFGFMFMRMFTHFWHVAEESPRLKKIRDRAALVRKRGTEKLTDEEKAKAIPVPGRASPGA